MSEEQTQEQTQDQAQEQAREQTREQDRAPQESQSAERMVPKGRFDEVNRRMQAAEKKAKEMESAQAQREEEQAQTQGEYKQLADKRAQSLKQKDERIKELETQMVRDRRYRAFVAAASGTIIPEAFDDAFSMLTDDEWSSANESDENSVRMLAQNLAERKPFLSDGPRGTGSGGSGRQVFGLASNSSRAPGDKQGEGRKAFNFKRQQRHW